jgi:acyl carrier protein
VEDIVLKIKELLVRVLDNGMTVDGIRSDGDLIAEYGMDSLQAISFLLQVEDAFELQLDFDELSLEDLRSVRLFSEYVAANLVGSR